MDEISGWGSATASALALVVSIAAAWIAQRVYRIEKARDRVADRDRAHRREQHLRAQAALVSAWAMEAPEKITKTIGNVFVVAAVKNGSDTPIYNVEIIYRDPGAGWLGKRHVPVVPPLSEPQIVKGTDESIQERDPQPHRPRRDGRVVLAASASMRVSIEFSDAEGLRWLRDERGRLSLLSDAVAEL